MRWKRLKDRHNKHQKCVDRVIDIVRKSGCDFSVVGRDELHRGLLVDRDLVIGVGGDGTILNCSSFLGSSIPLLGVNSDPTMKHEKGTKNRADERRSTGKLCATTSEDLDRILPRILTGDYYSPGTRSRIQCLVQSTYKTTRLPPALNDLLLANPIPAGVSRFRVNKMTGPATGYFNQGRAPLEQQFSFNAWSSGMWISTATGSTAAMKAAGGVIMDAKSPDLQYMVREHLVQQGHDETLDLGHGFLAQDEMLSIRWNSQYGALFADGAHMKHDLELGDYIAIDGHAPPLQLFDAPPDEE